MLQRNSIHRLHNGPGSCRYDRSSRSERRQVRCLSAHGAGQHERPGEAKEDTRELSR